MLVHDASVFLRPVGLPRLLRELSGALRSNAGGHDVLVDRSGQSGDGGGLLWFSGSRRSVRLLDCMVAATASGAGGGATHFQQSVGSVLEQLIKQSVVEAKFQSDSSNTLSACALPPVPLQRAVWAMGGHTSPRHRLVCARAAGVHGKRVGGGGGGASRALIYHVPVNASVASQKRAFAAALQLANKTGRALSLPRSGFSRKHAGGQPIPFCELFDLSSLPSHGPTLAASLSRGGSQLACESPLTPSAIRSRPNPRLLCASFDALADAYMGPTHLYACADPKAPHVLRAHACTEKADKPAEGVAGRTRRWVKQRFNALPSSVMNMIGALAKEGTTAPIAIPNGKMKGGKKGGGIAKVVKKVAKKAAKKAAADPERAAAAAV